MKIVLFLLILCGCTNRDTFFHPLPEYDYALHEKARLKYTHPMWKEEERIKVIEEELNEQRDKR